MELWVSLIVAVIAGVSSFAGTAVTNSKHHAVINERIENLTKQVEKHNSIIERTFKLEKDMAVLQARYKEHQND